MVAVGLDAHGHARLAAEVREAALDEVDRWYRTHGAIYEFYDADGAADPNTLARKGGTHGGVRDYRASSRLVRILPTAARALVLRRDAPRRKTQRSIADWSAALVARMLVDSATPTRVA